MEPAIGSGPPLCSSPWSLSSPCPRGFGGGKKRSRDLRPRATTSHPSSLPAARKNSTACFFFSFFFFFFSLRRCGNNDGYTCPLDGVVAVADVGLLGREI